MDSTLEELSPNNQKYVQSLCEKGHNKIRSVGHRYLDDISTALIDDLEQETFLQACINVETIMSHPKPEGWLIRTAINVARSLRRRELAIKRLESNITLDDMVKGAGHLEDSLPGSLKPKDRDILIRYYEDQDDIKQIALDLNMSEEAAKKRLQRARERLKEKLEEKK